MNSTVTFRQPRSDPLSIDHSRISAPPIMPTFAGHRTARSNIYRIAGVSPLASTVPTGTLSPCPRNHRIASPSTLLRNVSNRWICIHVVARLIDQSAVNQRITVRLLLFSLVRLHKAPCIVVLLESVKKKNRERMRPYHLFAHRHSTAHDSESTNIAFFRHAHPFVHR